MATNITSKLRQFSLTWVGFLFTCAGWLVFPCVLLDPSLIGLGYKYIYNVIRYMQITIIIFALKQIMNPSSSAGPLKSFPTSKWE